MKAPARSPWLPQDVCEDFLDLARNDFQTLERLIQKIYSEILHPGDTCLDGGAHRGLHTFPMANCVGESGRVVAVEALPDLAEKLRKRAADLPHVEVIEAALAEGSGHTSFRVVQNAPARSGLNAQDYPFDVKVEEIRVLRQGLDELLADAKRWRFAKLDLEGGEFHAIRSGRTVLRQHSPMIIFERTQEAPKHYGYSIRDFFDLFAEHDYVVCDLLGEPLIESEWNRHNRPWYAMAFKAGSSDDVFVNRGSFGEVLRQFVSEALVAAKAT